MRWNHLEEKAVGRVYTGFKICWDDSDNADEAGKTIRPSYGSGRGIVGIECTLFKH